MSEAILFPSETALPPLLPGQRGVVFQDQFFLPSWVRDLESYRRWAHSLDYPSRGWISYLHGQIWVDLTMEELFTHNQVKVAFTKAIVSLPNHDTRGMFVTDRMLLTNPIADLSTEPDGLFCFWETIENNLIRLLQETDERVMELEGTPDMVLEVISKSSLRKDTVVLRDLYWKAGIPEYWLVDARGESPKFDILVHGADGYGAAAQTEGWVFSRVFGAQFKLTKQMNPLGKPLFVVDNRNVQP